MMKQKHNAGFSLVEVIVAMAILASVVIPVCTGMMVSVRVNAKAEAMLRAKLAVSSTVETLRAHGVTCESENYAVPGIQEGEQAVQVRTFLDEGVAEEDATYYNVVVTDAEGLVAVTTIIHAVPADEEAGENQ